MKNFNVKAFEFNICETCDNYKNEMHHDKCGVLIRASFYRPDDKDFPYEIMPDDKGEYFCMKYTNRTWVIAKDKGVN